LFKLVKPTKDAVAAGARIGSIFKELQPQNPQSHLTGSQQDPRRKAVDYTQANNYPDKGAASTSGR